MIRKLNLPRALDLRARGLDMRALGRDLQARGRDLRTRALDLRSRGVDFRALTASPERVKALVAGGVLAVGGFGIAPAMALSSADHYDAAVAASTTAAVVEQAASETSPAAAPTEGQLHPLGITASQTTFTPSHEQLANAKAIVEAGKAMGLSPRAWTIAVATSLQESNLINVGDLGARNDHDSLGLFQQRPSSGWGTKAQVQNPTYAASAFYNALVRVSGWDSMPLTRAAQKVQVSAFPNHYAKHEAQAGDIIAALYGAGPYAALATDLR